MHVLVEGSYTELQIARNPSGQTILANEHPVDVSPDFAFSFKKKETIRRMNASVRNSKAVFFI